MMRRALAVIVAYLVWTALWLGSGASLGAAFPEALEAYEAGEPITETGYLVSALGLSVVCSFVAGIVCGKLARERSSGAALVLGAALLLTGIGVQASAWSLMPVWYHLVFLALLLPVVKWAAWLAARRTLL